MHNNFLMKISNPFHQIQIRKRFAVLIQSHYKLLKKDKKFKKLKV